MANVHYSCGDRASPMRCGPTYDKPRLAVLLVRWTRGNTSVGYVEVPWSGGLMRLAESALPQQLDGGLRLQVSSLSNVLFCLIDADVRRDPNQFPRHTVVPTDAPRWYVDQFAAR